MTAKFKPELTKLIKEYNLTKDDVWDCHGTWVMLHRACEKVALQLGIKFADPEVLFVSTDGLSVAMRVTGDLSSEQKIESAWSIGEASPKNNKNSYPWAMAEKRAKDRVILKLARFNECGVYSDIEADDFKPETKKRPENSHIKNDSLPHYSEDVNNALDPELVANTVIKYFDGNKGDARDFITDAGFAIPSECGADELRGILNALKEYSKKEK